MPEQEDEADIQPSAGEQPPDSDAQSDVAQPFQVEAFQPEDEKTQAGQFAPHVDQSLQVEAYQAEDEETQAKQLAPQEEQTEPTPPAREPRRLTRAERETVDRQRRRYTACGRCGYFIADCQIYLGEEALQTAILAARDGWLRLEGDRTFDRLVMNAYAIELDADFDSLDGTCPECRRRFVVVHPPAGPSRLKIRV